MKREGKQMNDRALLKEIQTEYFSIIDKYYASFYKQYLSSKISIHSFIKKYLDDNKIVLINNGDHYKYKKEMFLNEIKHFWKNYFNEIKSILTSFNSKALVGTIELNDACFFKNSIKQNALYFDLVVINDPFYIEAISETGKESNYHNNVFLFYKSLIYIYEIKEYVILNEEIVLAAVLPSFMELQGNELTKIQEECKNHADNLAMKYFNLDYKTNDVYEMLNILRKLSDEDISKILTENNILIDIREAQSYEWFMAGPDNLIKSSIELFGYFNRDFIRCILNNAAIIHIITDLLFVYNAHCNQANISNMFPIFNIYEWFPIQYYYSNIPAMNATVEYKYICAVQRNDKMAYMVQMNIDELIKFKASGECSRFREFFNMAANQINKTPDKFDDIAFEIFRKIDEIIDVEIKMSIKEKSKKKMKAILGVAKSAIGFVPILSYVSSGWDVLDSTNRLVKTFKKENDIIARLASKSDS